MEYKSQVPEDQQIALHQFPLYPGDRVLLRYRNGVFEGVVTEVGCANPEYVLGNPGDPDTQVREWGEEKREQCIQFLKNNHSPVKLRLKESMWATIVFIAQSRKVSKTYFTYEIMDLLKNGKLTFFITPAYHS